MNGVVGPSVMNGYRLQSESDSGRSGSNFSQIDSQKKVKLATSNDGLDDVTHSKADVSKPTDP